MKKVLVLGLLFIFVGLLGETNSNAQVTPTAGSIIFNEYASTNDANGNDFFELLTLVNNLDLRGLRVTDNEVLTVGGALNNGESVTIFGQDAFLASVPRGTRIAVYNAGNTGATTPVGITPDTTSSDRSLILTVNNGVTFSVDGLGGAVNAGLAGGGDALYLYLPGPDGTSAGTDNVYLDFISYGGDGGAVAPTAAIADINLGTTAPNAQYTGSTAAGNDTVANWTTAAALGTQTPGASNPGQSVATAAGVSASCKVLSVRGRGISRARVS
ncbi:MAG: hypothetical protein H7Z37_12170, partial [Pyrinomonadaceae bacterium]|nr:hypothetical protein [Pyrinomonadaceae bacterium]